MGGRKNLMLGTAYVADKIQSTIWGSNLDEICEAENKNC